MSQKSKNGPSVIIADDEPDTVATLAAILAAEGYEVTETSKGSEVLRCMARRKPDAVILDIDMPGMSGYTVAKEIREVFAEETPLLICISGKWIGQTDKMLADMAGFNHFLQKPCDPQVVLRLLEPLRLTPEVAPPAEETLPRLEDVEKA